MPTERLDRKLKPQIPMTLHTVLISGKVPFMSWQKSAFYEVNDWSLEPGNGVETNAFDDGGVFGEKIQKGSV